MKAKLFHVAIWLSSWATAVAVALLLGVTPASAQTPIGASSELLPWPGGSADAPFCVQYGGITVSCVYIDGGTDAISRPNNVGCPFQVQRPDAGVEATFDCSGNETLQGALNVAAVGSGVAAITFFAGDQLSASGSGLRINDAFTSSSGITSTAASSADAFKVSNNGARVHFGAGASDYCSSDGTTVTFQGPTTSQATVRATDFRTNSAAHPASFMQSAEYFGAPSTDAMWVDSSVTDNASAVAVKVGASGTLASAGAKLLSIGSSIEGTYAEKSYVDVTGAIFEGATAKPVPAVISASVAQAIQVGTQALTAGAATVTFGTAFAATPVCTATDQTAAAAVKVVPSTTQLAITGTSTDTIAWQCTGSR